MASVKRRVLFLCTENSCRSQMAEAITRHLWGDRLEAYSAGMRPKGVNPLARGALKEMGIEGIDRLASKPMGQFLVHDLDLIVTLCDNANERCPNFPGSKERFHLPFRDPSRNKGHGRDAIEDYIQVAKEIREALESLFRERGWI